MISFEFLSVQLLMSLMSQIYDCITTKTEVTEVAKWQKAMESLRISQQPTRHQYCYYVPPFMSSAPRTTILYIYWRGWIAHGQKIEACYHMDEE